MKTLDRFAAIDFEYLTWNRYDTPCAVGIVKVVDRVVVQKFYTLIRPTVGMGEKLAPNNGITWEMVENAPAFSEVYPLMEQLIGGLTMVAHNFATERKVLEETCALCGIKCRLCLDNHCDTDLMSGHRSLSDCCEEMGIPLNHHNALSDAEACAELFLRLQGTAMKREVVRTIHGSLDKYKEEKANCNPEVYRPLSDEEVENKETPFFGKTKTVVTGTFAHFPDRNRLKESLKALGADVDSGIGKTTQILVTGEGAGWSKLQKAEQQGVRIMREDELLKYLDPQV